MGCRHRTRLSAPSVASVAQSPAQVRAVLSLPFGRAAGKPGPGLRVNIQGNWKQDPLLESPIRAGIWCKQQGGRWSTRISASATASLGGGQGPCALTLVVPEGFH